MIERMKQTLLRKGYRILLRPMELNIIGIRHAYNDSNGFDDRIVIFYSDGKGNQQLHSFPATTDPGKYWLQHPMNEKGTAVLKEGQYEDAYMLGLHRGKYRALIQRKPVTVFRDTDRDSTAETTSVEDTGMFGINIHRALERTTAPSVDKFSAGCQVFQSPADFTLVIGLCDWHRRLYGNVFTYTLLSEKDCSR